MKKVQSADGTTIAFDQLGKGPALILMVRPGRAVGTHRQQYRYVKNGVYLSVCRSGRGIAVASAGCSVFLPVTKIPVSTRARPAMAFKPTGSWSSNAP